MNDGIRKTGHILFGNKVEATYFPCDDPMFRHNCFIEALPAVLSFEKAASLMQRYPYYNKDERDLTVMQRLLRVQSITNCVVPLPEYLELEQKISRMIRNGYMNRNPLTSEWTKQINSGFPNLDWDREGYEYTPLVRSNAAGFSIIGASGVGKSTMVETILSLYPQVIVHTEYNGHQFYHQQIVWMKIDCPFDGSLYGLCMSFFLAIDKIVGTKYYKQYGGRRRNIDELLPIMARLAGTFGLGALVIDEIQRLKEAQSGGAQKMLNFFVQLTSTFSVPVVLVGTYKAFNLFTKEFALARRMAGQGDVIMSNLAADDSWKYFINNIWKYQWTNTVTSLTPKISKALYNQSQGIVDIAVKLYMFAQWSVIGNNNEHITPNLFARVASEQLHAAGPILKAMRDRDYEKLSKIEDVSLDPRMLENYLQGSVRRVTISGVLNTLQNQTVSATVQEDNSDNPPEQQIAYFLVGAGYSLAVALECAKIAVKRFSGNFDLKLASSEAFRHAAEREVQKQSVQLETRRQQTVKKRKVVSLSGDLREIVSSAKGKSAYEGLKEAGIIKSPTDFLDRQG